jgi:hypothetical protein
VADPATNIRRLLSASGVNPGRQVIRAYHGSPHSFRRFDASKIGTGEGAQAYGHGLYFAGNEAVADVYRQQLAGSYANALAEPGDLPKYFAPGNVVDGYGGKDRVLEFLPGPDGPWDWRVKVIRVDSGGHPLPGERPRFHSTVPGRSVVDRYFGRTPRRPGHMYEVELDLPESSLLDWDAPMSRQPAAVLEAYGGPGSYHGMRDERLDGQRLWWNRRMSGTEADAAREMLERGIPGIRYLDQSSRAAGQGTHNYVMFPGTEDHIRILRQYGLLPPLAGGLAAGAMGDTEQ